MREGTCKHFVKYEHPNWVGGGKRTSVEKNNTDFCGQYDDNESIVNGRLWVEKSVMGRG